MSERVKKYLSKSTLQVKISAQNIVFLDRCKRKQEIKIRVFPQHVKKIFSNWYFTEFIFFKEKTIEQ